MAAPADPDALTRRSAGEYRTADERFTVRQADVGWFVVDGSQTNEFGQELIHGPYATLKLARAALPGVRAQKPAAKPRPKGRSAAAGATTATKAKTRPDPRSWIDELSPAEGRGVRRLVRALAAEGIEDAEDLVRRDRDGLLPAISERLIARRLAGLVEDLPEERRAESAELIQRTAQVLSGEGLPPNDPFPGWTLVEVTAEGEAPKARRIDLRR
jgi:hypothetical protein